MNVQVSFNLRKQPGIFTEIVELQDGELGSDEETKLIRKALNKYLKDNGIKNSDGVLATVKEIFLVIAV